MRWDDAPSKGKVYLLDQRDDSGTIDDEFESLRDDMPDEQLAAFVRRNVRNGNKKPPFHTRALPSASKQKPLPQSKEDMTYINCLQKGTRRRSARSPR